MKDLENYAREAIRLFGRSDYKQDANYNWIDYTVPVADPDEVDRVLDALLSQARSTPALEVDVVWADPDPATDVTPSYVCFPQEQSTQRAWKRTDMQWPVALAWLDTNHPTSAGHDVLRTEMRFFNEDTSPARRVDLWELLVTQVSVGNETYLVSDGEVWRASSHFIKDVDDQLGRAVEVNPTWLPRYRAGESEDSYNKRAASHGPHFLLDKKLIRLADQTPFEPCDLLSGDGRFMHVKRRSSASAVSHVGAQAIAATRLLREMSAARKLLDDELLKAQPPPSALNEMRRVSTLVRQISSGITES